MKHLAALFLLLAASSAFGQTVKTLGYNTTNGQVVYTGTNRLTFTNGLIVATQAGAFLAVANTNARLYRDPGSGTLLLSASGTTNTFHFKTDGTLQIAGSLSFGATTNATNYAAATRTNLGLGATWLTNTNDTNFRSAIGLGNGITTNITFVDASTNTNSVTISNGIITGWTQ